MIDDGSEFFGNATQLPDGDFAEHGFEALAVYDRFEFGGNEDGIISREDIIWPLLRLWVDWSHDGVSQPKETLALAQAGVVMLGLDYQESDEIDGAGNWHRYQGHFVRRIKAYGHWFERQQKMNDVIFVVADDHDDD